MTLFSWASSANKDTNEKTSSSGSTVHPSNAQPSDDTHGSVLSGRMTSGPIGLGDPTDRQLRKVETEVLIPKLLREKAKSEKCAKLKEDFDQCCIDNGMLMVVYCRKENTLFQDCMNTWFRDKDFVGECTELYLQQRATFRSTGIKQNPKAKKAEEREAKRKAQEAKEAEAAVSKAS